ncbi:mitotic fidelity of chromosome transmission- protein [Coemansia furcata]|uniref:Mitotic fidelity of chromosome transmission-protein n=1 Tax=Coemansia furcata TaxID=417177 RepID=A0ACC1LKY3_9FUNG|nr:mitotic fidelity of chromosome transmission- protein [Coemansia furcata]
MSNQAARRAKSPAIRNKFNDIGITGRKTGVRVAGNVRVDEDGLENVDEFYKKTSPAQDRGEVRGKTATLHKLLSPTPIRSTSNYGTLMGALDIPVENPQAAVNAALEEIEDEAIASPIQARAARLQFGSADMDLDTPSKPAGRRAGGRRATLAPARQIAEPSWVRSPKKGRRITMAFSAQQSQNGHASSADQHAEETESVPAAADNVDEHASPTHDTEDGSDDGFVPVSEAADVEDDQPANVIEEAVSSDDNDDNVGGPPSDEIVEEEFGFDTESPGDMRIEDDTIPDSQGEDNDEVPEPVKSPAKPAEKRATKAPAKKVTKEAAEQDDEVAIRRSTRASVQPLAYWRNEHIEYEYESGPVKGVAVPKMKNIVRVRQTAEEKNHAKKRRVKRGALPSLRGIKASEIDLADRGRFYYYDDENYGFPVEGDSTGKYGPKVPKDKAKGTKRTLEKFDDDDDVPVDERPQLVIDVDGRSERPMEVALARQSIEWSNIDTKGDKYKMGTGLFYEQPDGNIHASSGVLSLAVGGKKPVRNSMKRNLFYLVTSGQVEVELHGSIFKVGVLGQFLVPAFNSYSITNVGTHPAQLYYVHVSVPEVEVEESDNDTS